MSYTNNANDTVCAGKLPEPTMGETMKEISAMAEQNHLLVRRIRAFLTGASEEQNERTQDPRCFREELLKARYELFCVNEELGILAADLGLA